MNDEFDDDEIVYGSHDDYEAQANDWGNPEWEADEYENHVYSGCSNCGTGADELELTQSGMWKRHWSIDCPYCERHIAGGVVTWRERGGNVAVVMVGAVQAWLARLRVRRTESVGMDDIPF